MPGQSPVLKGSDGATPMWRALYELNLNKTTTFYFPYMIMFYKILSFLTGLIISINYGIKKAN